MSARRLVLLVIRALLPLPAVGLLLGGGAVLVLNAVHADPEGYLTTPEIRLDQDGHAVVSETARLELE